MAARRVRIKGIANIPQRRKNNELSTSESPSPPLEETAPLTNQPDISEQAAGKDQLEQHVAELSPPTQPIIDPPVTIAATEQAQETTTAKETIQCDTDTTTKTQVNTSSTDSSIETSSEVKPAVPDGKVNTQNASQETKKPLRRKFIKPTISVAAINGRAKRKESTNIEKPPSPPIVREEEINLNETILPTCKEAPVETANNNSVIHPVQDITKLPRPEFIEGSKPCSDSERPPPASSPSKLINRSRIKAVPRLGQHRSSFSIGSASESEDESRKSYSSRIRNDSVSSVVSEYQTNEVPVHKSKESTGNVQKKTRRSQRARNLAEARREFIKKCGNGQPDRQRLTMMDLLFYNPTTNPMSRKEKVSISESVMESEEVDGNLEESSEKGESNDTTETNNDQENEVPAPQIMIGANGEIIIDEKSLLIESSDVAKNREVLKNSRVIDGDNLDSPYATYRRAKKYKGWSNVETLRFYKAINTIGTDFSMMVQLFPGRTRQDLKVKFKAEERRNKDLIDKAVYNPITFDLTDMLREVEMEEFEKKQNQKRLKEIEEFKQQKAETRCSKRKKKKEVLKDARSDEDEPVYKRPKMSAKKYLDGGINSLFDSDNDDEASKDSSTVVEQPAAVADTPDLQTTITEDTNDSQNSLGSDSMQCSLETSYEDADLFENSEDLVPGSIIHVTEENEDGETVDRIYSIGENGEKILVSLQQDIIDRLVQNSTECENNKENLDENETGNNNNEKPSVDPPNSADIDIDNAEIILLDDNSDLFGFDVNNSHTMLQTSA